MAGQGFLDLMHIQVGAWISPTIDGVPVILHIVGRTIEPDNNGDVLDFGLNALPAAQAAAPPFYRLILKPGISPAAARTYLLQASHDRLDVQVVANPASQLGIMQVVIVVSVIILAVIALANLLTSTVVGLRDHLHEAGVLKAMGLTPRQVIATLVVNATILTTIGVTAGTGGGPGHRAPPDRHAGPHQRHGSGIATGLSRHRHRGDHGHRPGHRRRGRPVPGQPHRPDPGFALPAQPGRAAARSRRQRAGRAVIPRMAENPAGLTECRLLRAPGCG